MSDRAGKLVLPRYNSAWPGSEKVSPSGSEGVVRGGSWGGVECGESILLDIEGGHDEATTTTASGATSWWGTSRMISSPIMNTTVFTQLGSAVSSGWSRARGALISSASITSSYIRRVPALEKPFDLKEVSHTGDPNDI